MIRPGKFVVVSGPDGVGKSTLVNTLDSTKWTRILHPDSTTELGKLCRKMLKEAIYPPESIDFEAVFIADLICTGFKVEALLKKGTNTVMDRYVIDNLAYSSYYKFDSKLMLHISKILPIPDLQVVLFGQEFEQKHDDFMESDLQLQQHVLTYMSSISTSVLLDNRIPDFTEQFHTLVSNLNVG